MSDKPVWLTDKRYAHLRHLDARGWIDALEALANRLDGNSWKDGWRDFIPDVDNLQRSYIGPPIISIYTPQDELVPGAVPICVNLKATDEDLVRHFMQIILELRKEARLPSPSKQRGRKPLDLPNDSMGERQFEVWINNKIIALGDILAWRQEHGDLKITNSQIGLWLFPKDEQPARRVNGAEKVMRDAINSIPALWAQTYGTVSDFIEQSDPKE